MSNALSIPAVTASIIAILQARIDAATWTTLPIAAPGSLDDLTYVPGIVVHLYRIDRNGYRDNEDLPTRSSDGYVRQKPRTALDLHYLLVFHGGDDYETQRLIGVTAAALHAVPILSRDLVGSVGTTYPGVDGNDLDRADECVRVTPESLTLDELTRLWALYPVDKYSPTLGYVAGPVIVEADDTPGTVLPVAGFAVGARPLNAPRLDDVAGPDGPGAPIRAAAAPPVLRLLGAALAPQTGELLEVLVDGVPAAGVTVVSDRELTLPAPTQQPGPHSVRVIRWGAPLDPALSTTRTPASSLPVRFTILPTLVTAQAPGPAHAGGLSTGALNATVQPALGPTQRVRLLLDSENLDPPVSVALPVTIAAATTAISTNFADVPIDSYRVTLEVDGVRSVPTLDPSGHYVLPVVNL